MLLSTPYALSMFFTMTSILFGLFGLFNYNEYNTSKSRNFIVYICSAMSLWSFGYGASIAATTVEKALLWYHIGSMGYAFIFVLVLHYILFQTDHPLLPKKIYQYAILYLPAVVMIGLFHLPISGRDNGFEMIPTALGWVPKATSLMYDFFYYGYYSIFVIIGLSVIYRWIKKGQVKRDMAKFGQIAITILATVVLGTAFDLITYRVTGHTQPDYGPFIAILPASVVALRMEKEGLLNFYGRRDSMEILKSEAKEALFKYIAYAFLAGGLFAAVFEYFLGGYEVSVALVFGLIIALYGMFLRHILTSDYPDHKKDNLICILVALFVPYIMYFALIKGTGTVWPAPILFIVAFMLYNNRRLIIGVSFSVVISTLMIGILTPYKLVEIGWTDHILRVVLLALFIAFAMVINGFYLAKLRESRWQLKTQETIAKVTSLFARSNINDFECNFDLAMAMLGRHYQVDRVYYFNIDEHLGEMTFVKSWHNSGEINKAGTINKAPLKIYPWWIEELGKVGHINIVSVDDLPSKARSEKEALNEQRLKSTLAVPMYKDKKMTGFLGIAFKERPNVWGEQDIESMKILGNIFSDAVARYNAEHTLHRLAYKDYLTGLPNRAAFYDSLNRYIQLAIRSKAKLLVGLLDLDGFKQINDTYGHDMGDKVLVEVSRRIQVDIRATDMVCRFGGDEFLLYFYDVKDKQGVHKLGDYIMNRLRTPVQINGVSIDITASLGFVLLEEAELVAIDDVILSADQAMYEAKKKGKNQYNLYKESTEVN